MTLNTLFVRKQKGENVLQTVQILNDTVVHEITVFLDTVSEERKTVAQKRIPLL